MKISNSIRLVAALTVFAVPACEDATDTAETNDQSDGTGGGEVCDPEGANPAMGALFNAPVADDVEVVTKVPTHPGPPGPRGLP